MEKNFNNDNIDLFEEKNTNIKNDNLTYSKINNINKIDNLNIIEKNNLKDIIIKSKNKVVPKKNKLEDNRKNLIDLIYINEENTCSIKEPKCEENDEKDELNSISTDIISHCSSSSNLPDIENDIIKKNYICEVHNKKFIGYCLDCSKNICNQCVKNTDIHNKHQKSFYNKLILTEPQEQEYNYRLKLGQNSLKKLRRIIIKLCYKLINMNEIVLKNKLKKAYIKYYKLNIYQIEYARFVFTRYIIQKKISLINYQILVNVYQIKFKTIKFPNSKDIIEEAKNIIDFLANKDNNILRETNLPHSDIKINFNQIYIDNYYKMKKKKILENKIKESNNSIIEKKTINNIIKSPDQINYEEKKLAKEVLKNKNTIDKKKFMKEPIDQTKITTTTSIFLSNASSLKSENNKDIIDKKNPKIKKKITKNNKTNELYNKEEKLYKEIGEQLSDEYLNFIKDHPPLNDGIEVQIYKKIKFIYKDKINNNKIFSIYQGECQKGTQIRHGRGLFKWADGEKYIGYWANNKREGPGLNYYSNGNLYVGMYKNGKKEGKGKYKWKNGDFYEGMWKNGVKDGEGIYKCSNGDFYKGLFKNDKLNGKGVYTWKNKYIYEGDFKNNSIDLEGNGDLHKNINNNNKNNNEEEKTNIEVIKIVTQGKSIVKIINEDDKI